uniref:Uncharacterized protein n=1 Tax=Cacopsylla melanoneura TaxID=428564 RepID=A0A8D8QTQ2_9HEMI
MADNPEAKPTQSKQGKPESAWDTTLTPSREVSPITEEETIFNVSTRNAYEALSSTDEDKEDDESLKTVKPKVKVKPKMFPSQTNNSFQSGPGATKPIFIKAYGESTQKMADRVKAVCRKPFSLK